MGQPQFKTSSAALIQTVFGNVDLTGGVLMAGEPASDLVTFAREILAQFERVLGERHPETLAAATNVANTLRVAGDLDGGSARENPIVARDLLHATTRLGPAWGYYYQLLATAGWTSLPFLPRLRSRTLILAGDDDPIIQLVNGQLMHALIPDSRLHVYHGGHLALITEAAQLAPVVDEFLAAPDQAD